MFGQTLSSLTLTKPRIQGKKGQRGYIAFKLTSWAALANETMSGHHLYSNKEFLEHKLRFHRNLTYEIENNMIQQPTHMLS
jgi:hypothetical protein